MLTDKELDEIEARLARASTIGVEIEARLAHASTIGVVALHVLIDAVTLLAEVRRLRLDNDLREDQWP